MATSRCSESFITGKQQQQQRHKEEDRAYAATSVAVRSCLQDRYSSAGFKWGTPMQRLPPPPPSAAASSVATANKDDMPICAEEFDIIIASDVVYYPEGYQPLVDSLSSLLQHYTLAGDADGRTVKPLLILAHRKRHPDDSIFFDLLTAVPNIQIDLVPFTSSATSASEGELGSFADVKLFHVHLTK
jgi:hypothetical protein